MNRFLRFLVRPFLRMTGEVVLKSFSDADKAALREFRLSDDGIARVNEALQLYKESGADTAVATYHRRGPNRVRSLDELEEDIRRNAPLMRALDAARLTPREYLLTRESLLQSLMMWAMTLGDATALPPGASPANVEFIASRRVELEALGQRWRNWDDR